MRYIEILEALKAEHTGRLYKWYATTRTVRGKQRYYVLKSGTSEYCDGGDVIGTVYEDRFGAKWYAWDEDGDNERMGRLPTVEEAKRHIEQLTGVGYCHDGEDELTVTPQTEYDDLEEALKPEHAKPRYRWTVGTKGGNYFEPEIAHDEPANYRFATVFPAKAFGQPYFIWRVYDAGNSMSPEASGDSPDLETAKQIAADKVLNPPLEEALKPEHATPNYRWFECNDYPDQWSCDWQLKAGPHEPIIGRITQSIHTGNILSGHDTPAGRLKTAHHATIDDAKRFVEKKLGLHQCVDAPQAVKEALNPTHTAARPRWFNNPPSSNYKVDFVLRDGPDEKALARVTISAHDALGDCPCWWYQDQLGLLQSGSLIFGEEPTVEEVKRFIEKKLHLPFCPDKNVDR